MKTFLTAAVLALAPMGAFAMCSGYGHETTAQSCAPGFTWDEAKAACVEVVSG